MYLIVKTGMVINVWCVEREEGDVDVEDWVACETCSGWIHSSTRPPIFLSQRPDFHCQFLCVLKVCVLCLESFIVAVNVV